MLLPGLLSRVNGAPQAMAQEACALMWALMDYSPHLMEDFMHANLEAPEAARPLPGLGSAWPAVMVRQPSNHVPPWEGALQAGGEPPGLPDFLEGLGWADLGMPAPDADLTPEPFAPHQARHST